MWKWFFKTVCSKFEPFSFYGIVPKNLYSSTLPWPRWMSQPNFPWKGFILQLHIMAAPTFKGASAAGCQNLLQHAIHIIIPMVCIPKKEVFERSVGLCSRTRRLNPLSLSQLHPHFQRLTILILWLNSSFRYFDFPIDICTYICI